MKKGAFITLLIITCMLISGGCRKNIYRVNVSDIDISVRIKRLEQDLFSISPARIADTAGYLKREYGDFLKYFSYVINIGELSDSAWSESLVRFCTDKLNNEVFSSTISVYPDLQEIENDLTDAFRHYKHYFPEKSVPAIYSCITGFNNSLIIGDSVLGIGIDRYLGSSSRFYLQLMLYKYQTVRMNPENIVPDCIYGWGASEWDFAGMGYEQDNVLSEIIHQGKLYYFTRCMLPEKSEDDIFAFNSSQLEFCRKNEGGMWQYLVENNLIFSTDHLTCKKLTGEAAFTSYFSTESPGRAALWIGFRIVESYMSRNRDVTLEELMNEKNIQDILEKARYRPPAG